MDNILEGVTLTKKTDGYHLLVPDTKNNAILQDIREGPGKINVTVDFRSGSGDRQTAGFTDPNVGLAQR